MLTKISKKFNHFGEILKKKLPLLSPKKVLEAKVYPKANSLHIISVLKQKCEIVSEDKWGKCLLPRKGPLLLLLKRTTR